MQSTQTAAQLDGFPSGSLQGMSSGSDIPVHARTPGQAGQNPAGLMPGVEGLLSLKSPFLHLLSLA